MLESSLSNAESRGGGVIMFPLPVVCVCGHHLQQTGHQLAGMVADPACGQLNRETGNFPSPRSRLRVWSRELGSAVPSRVSPLVLHTQVESDANLRDSTSPCFPLRFPLEPSYAIGLVPSLSGHAIALPMAFTTENRHRGSSSQGSSTNESFLFR